MPSFLLSGVPFCGIGVWLSHELSLITTNTRQYPLKGLLFTIRGYWWLLVAISGGSVVAISGGSAVATRWFSWLLVAISGG